MPRSITPAGATVTWNQTFTDNFSRANGPIGGTWINTGNEAAIVNDQLSLSYNGAAPWADTTLRPASENQLDQRVVIDSAAGNSESSAGVFATVRYQDASDNYWGGMYNGTVWIGSIQGGNQVNFNGGGTALSSYNSSDTYSLDVSAVGSSPTTLTATVTDTTTNTVVGTASTTDSTSAMQQAGQSGMWFATGTSGATWAASSFTTYDDGAATSYSLTGPASAQVGQASGDYTVTPDGTYTGTITPSDGGAGGTFTPSSLSFSASQSPQTFTYTPASSGTVSISTISSPGLTDPSALSVDVSGTVTWNQTFTDNFSRANGPIGGTWINTGNEAAIVNDQLSLSYNGAAPWADTTLRPASENQLDQRVVIDSAAGNSESSAGVFATVRYQDASDNYWGGMYNGTVWIGSIQGGNQVNFNGGGTALSSYNSSDTYSLDVSAVGSSPTTLTATVTDTTTNTVVGTASTTDSTSAMQQAGQSGMWFATGTSGATWAASSFTTYDDGAATSYSLTGPASAQVGQASGDYTVTPDGTYTGTITPSDGGAGGTFTPSSLSFSASQSPQTFTYTPASSGTVSISTISSPGLTDPSALSVDVSGTAVGQVSVDNPDLIWSPYNWQFNGSSWAQTSPGGAYVKFAFTGSTLGINIDQSMLNGIDPSQMDLDAYVDGSSTPITKTFADATGNGRHITFTTSLSAGDHYAVIYFAQSPFQVDRWIGPADDLRVTSLQLAADGSGVILPPAGTPVAPKSDKVIFFGDSITEGYHDTSDENAYSADVAKLLGNVEYGQIAYSGAGWDISAPNNVPDFSVNAPNQSTSFWENYNSSASRLVNPSNLSEGFIGGAPDAVYVNMGINDADNGAPAADLESKMNAWLSDIRTTIGPRPEVFVIVPFNFGSGNFPTYKADLLAGVSDYENAHPADSRVDVIDLGASGWDIVQANSTDGLHPNDTGAMLLADQIAADSAPLISGVLQPGSLSSGGPLSATTANLQTSAPTSGIAPYGYQWYRSTTANFTPDPSSLVPGATGPTLQDVGLSPDTTYYYKVVYGDSTNPDQSVTSDQFSVTTLSPPEIVNLPASGTVGGSFQADAVTNGDGAVSVVSSTPDVCTATGASGLTVSFVGAGTCTLTAEMAAGSIYSSASGEAQSLVVDGLPQAPLALTSQIGTVGVGLTLTSSGGSGTGAVGFAVTNGGSAQCSLNNGIVLSAISAGTCSVTVTRASDDQYLAASSPATTVTFTTSPHAATGTFVGIAATPDGHGYWLVTQAGDVSNFGNAGFFGSMDGLPLKRPIVGMAATPSGHGYWLVASDGGVFSFGDASFYGSTGGLTLNRPIVGMAATPSGHGYWLVASDGGVFSFGDASFYGSTGGLTLNRPIVGMAATPSGHGYWLVASDGGVFSFGDASFYGSTGGLTLNRPIVGMAATPSGHGYWLVASDGGVFSFGDAPFQGSMGNHAPNTPIVGIGDDKATNGYWEIASDGGVFALGSQFFGSK